MFAQVRGLLAMWVISFDTKIILLMSLLGFGKHGNLGLLDFESSKVPT